MPYTQNDINEMSSAVNAKLGFIQANRHVKNEPIDDKTLLKDIKLTTSLIDKKIQSSEVIKPRKFLINKKTTNLIINIILIGFVLFFLIRMLQGK